MNVGLSSDLISQFVKATKNEPAANKETTVQGVAVEYNGSTYVKLDGSDRLTPVSFTTDAKPGDRVNVTIKNHAATVTGNLSSPSARTDDLKDTNTKVEEIGNQISEFEIVIADKVSTKEFDAQKGRIDTLTTENVTIKERLTATEASIDDIEADNVVIHESLTASSAEIEDLKTKKLDAEVATATYATIKNLEAVDAKVYNLQVVYGDFEELTTNKFAAIVANIEQLETDKLDAETANITFVKAVDIEGKYANIDFSNIGKAAIEQFYSKSGLIKDLVVGDGTITGELVGVTIKGDLVEAGTLKADKLVIKGSDGIYYKLNTDGETVESEQTEYNSLDGSHILAKSVTASKITVDDLVAFNATIGGFHISDHAIYSGVKETIDNTTRGMYLGDDGQFNFGDSSSYAKYYKGTDGEYHLDISAENLYIGGGTKNVETAIEDVKNDIDNLEIGGRNLLLNSKEGTLKNPEQYLCAAFELSEEFIAGEQYTIQCNATCSSEKKAMAAYVGSGSHPCASFDKWPVVEGENTYVYTFTASESMVSAENYIYFYSSNNAGSQGSTTVTGTCNVNWAKLEKGNRATDWTPAPEDVETSISDSANALQEVISNQYSEIIKDTESIILQALTEYVKTGDYEEYKQSISTSLELMSDQIQLNFTTTTQSISNVDGDLQSKFTELYRYIHFVDGSIVLGASDSAITLTVENDMIVFKRNGEQFGWWDGVDFHTGNIVVELNERAQFGNFAFVPRSDGSLSFLKVGE